MKLYIYCRIEKYHAFSNIYMNTCDFQTTDLKILLSD